MKEKIHKYFEENILNHLCMFYNIGMYYRFDAMGNIYLSAKYIFLFTKILILIANYIKYSETRFLKYILTKYI